MTDDGGSEWSSEEAAARKELWGAGKRALKMRDPYRSVGPHLTGSGHAKPVLNEVGRTRLNLAL